MCMRYIKYVMALLTYKHFEEYISKCAAVV